MTHRTISLTLLAAVLATGCTGSHEESGASAISSALEADDGELGMHDEAPAFGMEAELGEARLLEGDPAMDDAMAESAEAVAAREAPGGARLRVAILWGRLPPPPAGLVPAGEGAPLPPPPGAEPPPDASAPDGAAPAPDGAPMPPRIWNGVLAVSRGALVVDRPIMFEPETDRVLPRRDPRAVAFMSATFGHVDGLALTILDPTPGAEEPLTLTYVAGLPEAPVEGELPDPRLVGRTVVISELLGHPVVLGGDDRGNHIIATVAPRPIDGCEQGLLMGRWNRVEEGRGRILGRVVDETGELRGHVRGLYGVRRSGEQVFFGKFIDREGHFRGIFRGRYDAGHFEGRWVTRDGERGGLGGEYREGPDGADGDGHFFGRFGQPSCRPPAPEGAPEPAPGPV